MASTKVLERRRKRGEFAATSAVLWDSCYLDTEQRILQFDVVFGRQILDTCHGIVSCHWWEDSLQMIWEMVLEHNVQ